MNAKFAKLLRKFCQARILDYDIQKRIWKSLSSEDKKIYQQDIKRLWEGGPDAR